MKAENTFYIFKGGQNYSESIYPGYTYDLSTGEEEQASGSSIIYKHSVNCNKILINLKIRTSRIVVLKWNEEDEYLGYDVLNNEQVDTFFINYTLYKNVKSIGFLFEGTTINDWFNIEEKRGFYIIPHYKSIKKKYKKENSQMFFRESLDGKINLFGDDYQLIKNSSIEETLLFYIFKNDNIYATASFNKSDCVFNDSKKSVELKLTYDDKYSKILDAYENTYDIIKLMPKINKLTLTKRCVIQIYMQGENILSNYAGGTYWETDVSEQINSEEQLATKYFFSKGPRYVEVDLQGFNYDINAIYVQNDDNNIWNAISKVIVYRQGQRVVERLNCSIVFRKVYNAGTTIIQTDIPKFVRLMSTGKGKGISDPISEFGHVQILYDTYEIEIWTGKNGTGLNIYKSDEYFGKDTGIFTLAVDGTAYPMSKVDQPVSYKIPTPANFYLGDFVIEHQVWGRVLCDADRIPDGQGGYIDLHDLPMDDFATPRRNYRKCIGLRGFDTPNDVLQIFRNVEASEEPTAYGMNDYGEYFIPPYTLYGQYFYPLARNSWANMSLWVKLGSSSEGIEPFETFCSDYYKEYTLNNSYHIADVIKALLKKIDPSISHDNTPEYSSFLYGHTGGTSSALGNCNIFLTQKTNILKGEYDQAAQKAEIKFKQLMDMLRDCFRCYWFIDSQNRFRIEHISYFMNGFSYNNPVVQLDLTSKFDKFNKKVILYGQQGVEYDKSELISRYEFEWMDDTTKVMGSDLYIDVNNSYIKKDETQEIAISSFTSDIDYMMFLPDDFSNDGFALIMANSQNKVPIINKKIKDEKQYNREIDVYVQNWYASFINLIEHYTEDLSGNRITYNNIDNLVVRNVKKCMKQDIDFPMNSLNFDINKLIKTDVGNGYINEVSTDIDTNLTNIELRYNPV